MKREPLKKKKIYSEQYFDHYTERSIKQVGTEIEFSCNLLATY